MKVQIGQAQLLKIGNIEPLHLPGNMPQRIYSGIAVICGIRHRTGAERIDYNSA